MGTEKKTAPEDIAAATEKPLTADRIMEHAAELPDQLREIAKKGELSGVDQGALLAAAVVIGAQGRELQNTVDKDDLFEAAVMLDSAWYIAQDLSGDFFDKFHPDKPEDRSSIAFEFTRMRGKYYAVFDFICRLYKVFKKQGIAAYYDCPGIDPITPTPNFAIECNSGIPPVVSTFTGTK